MSELIRNLLLGFAIGYLSRLVITRMHFHRWALFVDTSVYVYKFCRGCGKRVARRKFVAGYAPLNIVWLHGGRWDDRGEPPNGGSGMRQAEMAKGGVNESYQISERPPPPQPMRPPPTGSSIECPMHGYQYTFPGDPIACNECGWSG